MRLYFLRHADAFPGTDDAVRPLSPLGKDQSRAVGKFLKKAGVEFDAAYSSPLVRAVETAELGLEVCASKDPLKFADALLNETGQGEFDRWLKDLPDVKRVLLVGHEPSMSGRVRHLLGFDNASALSMPKAGLACVDTGEEHGAVLKLFISPKSLGL